VMAGSEPVTGERIAVEDSLEADSVQVVDSPLPGSAEPPGEDQMVTTVNGTTLEAPGRKLVKSVVHVLLDGCGHRVISDGSAAPGWVALAPLGSAADPSFSSVQEVDPVADDKPEDPGGRGVITSGVCVVEEDVLDHVNVLNV